MKLKALVIGGSIFFVLLLILFFRKVYAWEEYQEKRDLIIQSSSLNEYIENVTYEYKNAKWIKTYYVTMKLQLKDNFADLPLEKKYMLVSLLHKNLQLEQHEEDRFDNSTLFLIYRIDATYKNQRIKYAFKPNSDMIINGKTVTEKQLKRYSEYPSKDLYTSNGHSQREVYLYMKRFYDVLTRTGIDYRPYEDNQLIYQAVKDKYGLTNKEITEIYYHFYLYIDFFDD
ncbi:hypothetical protein [Bacillus sp. 1P06AnD]|uniref:hypothetical protein n=1 Tax=Bacillus sp. 1P06AnD TaxID=3132208 RepID=UPI00399F3388